MSAISIRRWAAAGLLTSLGAAATVALRQRRRPAKRVRDEPVVEWRRVPNFKQ